MSRIRPRLVVLVNASARQSPRERWRHALSVLEARASVTVSVPPTAGAMSAAAQAAVNAGVDTVVVVGGDGTVNCVAGTIAG